MSRSEFPSMRLSKRFAYSAFFAGIMLTIGGSSSVFADDREEFFESKVRPLFVEHCVECHGPDDQSGELRLDRKVHVQKGGAAGPLFVAGNPDASRLIRAIRYQDNALQMPPDNKLSEEAINLLTEWVKSGAYWPDEPDTEPEPSEEISVDQVIESQRKSHWSYQPIVAKQPPELESLPPAFLPKAETVDGGELDKIDRFVLSRLAKASIAPNGMANRRTLIHRAYFTLIGMPPSFTEVQDFLNDTSPNAFGRVIDRLLESPHYGERWARHWLDLARYGDTKGYLAGSRETRYPFAFTYRDYVIDALNEDKPFDQFIVEQLAADQLGLDGEARKNLAAMGLLTVGRKFMNRRADIIDDQIDVVTRGFLGITVACARCHDHKYDAVPTADYYSLYGVFDSSREPDEFPLLGEAKPSKEYDSFLAAKAAKQAEVDKWLDERGVETEHELRTRTADYLVMLPEALQKLQRGKLKFQGERGPLRRAAAFRWYQYLANPATSPEPIWALWRHLSAIPTESFAEQLPTVLDQLTNESAIENLPTLLIAKLQESKPKSMTEAAKVFGAHIESIYSAWKEQSKQDPKLERLANDEDEAIRKMIFAPSSPTTLDRAQMIAHLDQTQRNRYNQLLNQVNGVEVTHPGAPPRGMVLVDKPKPVEPVIFRRGVPSNRGDRVPRRFLQVLSHVDGGNPFANGSGRLELARAIANPENPLTARVIVNRIWQHHFGEGLVRTPSDFGIRGEPPTHPDLLDTLAAEFIADGWSIKRLHRRIMLSATWQRSSQIRSDAMTADPDNRLLWHMPRRRLEFEPLRDRLLIAAGRLDDRVGGRSVKIHEDAKRRALYAYIDREDLPGLLASFDLPSPDASQAKRTQTTVPQQALYLMNSPFVIEQAKALAKRSIPGTKQSPDDQLTPEEQTEKRIRRMYRLALSRHPSDDEIASASAFADPKSVEAFRAELVVPDAEKPRWLFGYGVWNQPVDTMNYKPLPYFSGDAWQASSQFPDARLKYLRLTAAGGHAGAKVEQSPIRRWVSPVSGVVRIGGLLKHEGKKGDGIAAQIVHSRLGIQNTWKAYGSESETSIERIEIKPGETLDFVVGMVGNHSFDSFSWAPWVELVERTEASDSTEPKTEKQWQVGHRWNANEEFARDSERQSPANSTPPLDPWTQLAQVLLLSNEFAFVD